MKLPLARNENIVVQETGDETLVYDLLTNKAFCLNETSSKVFRACGDNQTFEDLKSEHSFTDDIIYLSLDELKKNNLLKADYDSPFAGMNRREVIRRIGLASMVALPLVVSLAAPKAVDAASGANQCQNANCVDRNQQCNNGSPCSDLGANFVCCASLNTCACTTITTCANNNGQICP